MAISFGISILVLGLVVAAKLQITPYLITNTNETYSYLGNRIMQFYHPLVKYNKYSNDIEMAISFDRQYTIEEVKSKLPKDVDINWLWVDNYKGYMLEGIAQFDNGITKRDAQIITEDDCVGFSTIERDGEIKKDPIGDFIETLEMGINRPGRYKKYINDIYSSLKGNDNNLVEGDIKLIGAVVVSNKEGLSKLKGSSMIKSSSFGVINDKY